jgi:hypothetical protein
MRRRAGDAVPRAARDREQERARRGRGGGRAAQGGARDQGEAEGVGGAVGQRRVDGMWWAWKAER